MGHHRLDGTERVRNHGLDHVTNCQLEPEYLQDKQEPQECASWDNNLLRTICPPWPMKAGWELFGRQYQLMKKEPMSIETQQVCRQEHSSRSERSPDSIHTHPNPLSKYEAWLVRIYVHAYM